ncbi:MAG: thiamine-phosphate kinase [Gammaproteobacteria bacterium]|nr:thiamine-phosphate kinase [Gammaproteobacteria bacterium]
MNEFELIRCYFARQPVQRVDVVVGIGDDAAVLDPPSGCQLVVSADMLVTGVHFPQNTAPAAVGYKALAVNLSDLAAMGASPAWFTLSLSLPEADSVWLEEFCEGLFSLAGPYGLQLIGGDTTRGPLTIGIQITGLVPRGQALLRSGACPGDGIYVTGMLGDAALGLMCLRNELQLPAEQAARVVQRLERPAPRVREGEALRGLASACIDISDGLVADLGHVLEASGVGASIELAALPLSPVYQSVRDKVGWNPAVARGDDYELCFTLPPPQQSALEAIAGRFGCGLRRIGVVEARSGLRLREPSGLVYQPDIPGFDHFHAS